MFTVIVRGQILKMTARELRKERRDFRIILNPDPEKIKNSPGKTTQHIW